MSSFDAAIDGKVNLKTLVESRPDKLGRDQGLKYFHDCSQGIQICS